MTLKPLKNGKFALGIPKFIVLCTVLTCAIFVQSALAQSSSSEQAAAKIPGAQLDSLVAPIALYPDPLLSQMLVASTYPLEVIQLQQWLGQNKNLTGSALTAAVQKQRWDASIQGLAGLPEAVKRLSENISWTTDLGNAFLAQQSDVMDAVQRMRAKAKGAGNLTSNAQQKVEVKTVESKTVIVVEPASPQVVYVPSYNPVYVYGPPVYPYPPIYYPVARAVTFGVRVAVGAIYHGGWGYGCGWGHSNNITINHNNNFVKVNNSYRSGGNNWQHNPQHRGGTPYANKQTANKFGGTSGARSTGARQTQARQQQARQQQGNFQSSARNTNGFSNNSASMNKSAFGGASNGNQARSASSRGSSSMRSSPRGGGRRR